MARPDQPLQASIRFGARCTTTACGPTANVVTKRLRAPVRYVYRAAMPRIELFPFRYRNPVDRQVGGCAHMATREDREGQCRMADIGRPEIRDLDPDARYFTSSRITPHPERCACSNSRN